MKYLLDVNILIAGIWDSHIHHEIVFEWLKGREIVLCPLAEMGFLRISTHPGGYNFSMEVARQGLKRFRTDRKAMLITDDLDVFNSNPKTSAQVPDHYLADLAAQHGLKLATLDTGLKHTSAQLVS
jgi:toxin-antitoxin system PIN domain toxin